MWVDKLQKFFKKIKSIEGLNLNSDLLIDQYRINNVHDLTTAVEKIINSAKEVLSDYVPYNIKTVVTPAGIATKMVNNFDSRTYERKEALKYLSKAGLNNPVHDTGILTIFDHSPFTNGSEVNDSSYSNAIRDAIIHGMNMIAFYMSIDRNSNFLKLNKVVGTNELANLFRDLGDSKERNFAFITQYLNNNFQFLRNNTRELMEVSSRGPTITNKIKNRLKTLFPEEDFSDLNGLFNALVKHGENNVKIQIAKRQYFENIGDFSQFKNVRMTEYGNTAFEFPKVLDLSSIDYDPIFRDIAELYLNSFERAFAYNDQFNNMLDIEAKPYNPHPFDPVSVTVVENKQDFFNAYNVRMSGVITNSFLAALKEELFNVHNIDPNRIISPSHLFENIRNISIAAHSNDIVGNNTVTMESNYELLNDIIPNDENSLILVSKTNNNNELLELLRTRSHNRTTFLSNEELADITPDDLRGEENFKKYIFQISRVYPIGINTDNFGFHAGTIIRNNPNFLLSFSPFEIGEISPDNLEDAIRDGIEYLTSPHSTDLSRFGDLSDIITNHLFGNYIGGENAPIDTLILRNPGLHTLDIPTILNIGRELLRPTQISQPQEETNQSTEEPDPFDRLLDQIQNPPTPEELRRQAGISEEPEREETQQEEIQREEIQYIEEEIPQTQETNIITQEAEENLRQLYESTTDHVVTSDVLGITEEEMKRAMDEFEQRTPAGGGHWEIDENGNRVFKDKVIVTKDTLNKLKLMRETIRPGSIGLVGNEYVPTLLTGDNALKRIVIKKNDISKILNNFKEAINKYENEYLPSLFRSEKLITVIGRVEGRGRNKKIKDVRPVNPEYYEMSPDEQIRYAKNLRSQGKDIFVLAKDDTDFTLMGYLKNNNTTKNDIEKFKALLFGAIHKIDGNKVHIYYDNLEGNIESLMGLINPEKIKFGFKQPFMFNGIAKVISTDQELSSRTLNNEYNYKVVTYGNEENYLLHRNRRYLDLTDINIINNFINNNEELKIFNLNGEPNARDYLSKGFLLPTTRVNGRRIEKGFLFIPKSIDVSVTFGNEIEGMFENLRRTDEEFIKEEIEKLSRKIHGINIHSHSVLKEGGVETTQEYSTPHKYELIPGVFQGFRGLRTLYTFYDILQRKLEHIPYGKFGSNRMDMMGVHINIGTIPNELRRETIMAAADYNRATEEVRKRMITTDERYLSWTQTEYTDPNTSGTYGRRSFMVGVYEGLKYSEEFKDRSNKEYRLRNFWSQSLDKFRVVKIPEKRELEEIIRRGGEESREDDKYRKLGLETLKQFLDVADELEGISNDNERVRRVREATERWTNELRNLGADDDTIRRAEEIMNGLLRNRQVFYGKEVPFYEFLRTVGLPAMFTYKGVGPLGEYSYLPKVQTISYRKLNEFGIFEVRIPDFASNPETNINLNLHGLKMFGDVVSLAFNMTQGIKDRLYIGNRVLPPDEGWDINSDVSKQMFEKIAQSILFIDDPTERELLWTIHSNCKSSSPKFRDWLGEPHELTERDKAKMRKNIKNFFRKKKWRRG